MDFWDTVSQDFRKIYSANICKHHTQKKGRVQALGDRFTMNMPLSDNGKPDYCLECISRMSIQCAWCSNSINIGDPVTLHLPRDGEVYEAPLYAVRYPTNGKHFVGCLRWDCSDGGGIDRVGFWMPPGQVNRVPSPIEMLLASGTDEGVLIVEDLSNPNDFGRIVNV